MVQTTVNGRASEVAAGVPFLEVCHSIGVDIPGLCYDSDLPLAGIVDSAASKSMGGWFYMHA
jgi:NADH dehydrogenase/NADH:ubiquinone oxidoreductase subunit G